MAHVVNVALQPHETLDEARATAAQILFGEGDFDPDVWPHGDADEVHIYAGMQLLEIVRPKEVK